MTDIDKVAKAIVASMEEQCDFKHVGLIGAHLDWRKVAKAAVDALQLREDQYRSAMCPDDLDYDRVRLLGPWRAVDQDDNTS